MPVPETAAVVGLQKGTLAGMPGGVRALKSEETYRLEEIITLATWKPGMIGCAEVGLGKAGIVDYVTMELKGERTIRCYELKITKSDFLSDAKKTFAGDFNFYVIPSELYESVKAHIEPWVGCWTIDRDGKAHPKKAAKRMRPVIDRTYVMGRIVLALERQHLKYVEKDWQDVQLAKPITDYDGVHISIGCKVRWNGKPWIVNDITRERMDTVLEPICHLTPIGWHGDDAEAKPAALRLIKQAGGR